MGRGPHGIQPGSTLYSSCIYTPAPIFNSSFVLLATCYQIFRAVLIHVFLQQLPLLDSSDVEKATRGALVVYSALRDPADNKVCMVLYSKPSLQTKIYFMSAAGDIKVES